MDNAECGDVILVQAFSHCTFYKRHQLKTDKFDFSFSVVLLVDVLEMANRYPVQRQAN